MAQRIFKHGIVEKLRNFILLQPTIEIKYCRLCLSSIDNHFKKLFSLFNPRQNIAEVIEEFAGVTISEEDQYSKFICLNCFSKLTESENFKNLIEDSAFKLRNQQTRCYDPVETSTDNNECVIDEDGEDKKIDVNEIDLKKELRTSGIELDEDAFDNLVERDELIEGGIDNMVKAESDGEMTEDTSTALIENDTTETNVILDKTESGGKRIKNSSDHKCPECDKVFTQHQWLTEHMCSHTNNYPFYCSYCSKGIPSKYKLKVHELIHTSKSAYRCEVCGLGFEDSSFLSEHSKSHQSEEPSSRHCVRVKKRIRKVYNLKCPECDQTFTYHYGLKKHMITHTGIYPFHCSFCKKGFAAAVPLKIHELTHTGGARYQCEICGKGFMQHQVFVYHMMKHKGRKPFNCEQCNKGFMSNHMLKIHVSNIHSSNTEEPNFTCDICRKLYKTKFDLDKHIKRCHVPHTLITCGVCGRAVRNYKDHMKLHFKPYKCTECKESFSSLDCLRGHSTVHTGKRLYECDLCQKTFSFYGSLFKHRKTHDSKNHFKCELCDKHFLYKHHWKTHLERVHK